ncbi:tetratricopeptide repeat protein [Marinobacter litoralis]|uniref:tetratricopeptide repeat protein n=1 Tax=Marinobacter litoralis TaxID=187981 RepID=UPI0018EABC27|nr:tetratricopeptide repeat protein [Marinobacter litoralis]MBJ6136155.1 tetratricopeptide repeat protein [Marinobacter litoralis]
MRQRKPAFFSVPALLALAALIMVTLYLLFPRQAIYEDPGYLESPDSISLAYLETLLKSDPDNQALRLTLGRMQQKIGEHQKAIDTLSPLIKQPNVPLEAMTAYTALLRGNFFRAQTALGHLLVRSELATTLSQALLQPYALQEKQTLMADNLTLLTENEQLTVRQQFFELATGTQRLRAGQALAKLQEAVGLTTNAIYTLDSVSRLVPPQEADAFVANLIRLDLAIKEPQRAFQRFLALHRNNKLDAQQLRQGIRLANFAGQPKIRNRWIAQLAKAEPSNLNIQRELLAHQLGQNNLRDALKTAQRIEASGQSLPPTDQEQLAQLYEWSNQPDKALAYWRTLFLEQSPNDSTSHAYERATNLAEGLFQWPTLVELHEVRAKRRQLSEQGYIQLTDALIRVGDWAAANRYLLEGTRDYPASSTLRQRELALLTNNRQFFEAIDLLEAAPSLNDEERVQLANLHWRTRNPEAALAELAFTPKDPALAQEVETMRLSLARMLNRTDILEQYFHRVAEGPVDTLSVETRDQLIGYSWQFGTPEETLRLSKAQYQATGETRHLAIVAELQSSLGRFRELAQSLGTWSERLGETKRDPRFWRLSARMHQQQNNPQAAQRAYLQAYRLAPENTGLLSAWGWFLISQPDLLPGRLPLILATLEDSPAAKDYALQVYGHYALGHRGKANAWLSAARQHLTDDPSQLLALADYAEAYETGKHAEAEALRQQAVLHAGTRETLAPDVKDRLYANLWDPQRVPREPLYQSDNRALQIDLELRDLGDFALNTAGLTGQFSHDRYRWMFSAGQSRANDRGRLKQTPKPGTSGKLQWQNNYVDHLLTAEIGLYSFAGGEQTSGRVQLDSQPTDGVTIAASASFNERVNDSAEAWWLASANRLSLSTSYTPWSRMTVGGSLDYRFIDEAFGGQIGNGYNANLQTTYRLFESDPAWRLSLNYQRQSLNVSDNLSSRTLSLLESPLAANDLLSEDYERVGFTSEWSHGEPHALYRSRPSPRYFLALDTGYVVSNASIDFGARAGLGWRVLGDDELALSAGYSSDSLGGEPRANAKLTYTLYFGH